MSVIALSFQLTASRSQLPAHGLQLRGALDLHRDVTCTDSVPADRAAGPRGAALALEADRDAVVPLEARAVHVAAQDPLANGAAAETPGARPSIAA